MPEKTDFSAYVTKDGQPPKPEEHAGGVEHWLTSNVWAPMVNGTGFIQVYNTFADKPAHTLEVAPAKTGGVEWAVQSISGAIGAIGPYVIAGKVAGKLLGTVGEGLELRGAAARAVSSGATARILGAGGYEMLKEPEPGATRLGNALGTMAGFGVFEAGNALLGSGTAAMTRGAERAVTVGVGRIGVGSIGGLTTYETSHVVASLQGQKDTRNWDDRVAAMAGGGFINFGLPLVHQGLNRAIDAGYNSRSFGPGVPVERYLANNGIEDAKILHAARWNPLARVKVAAGAEAETKADVQKNVVYLSEKDTPARLAHELMHLRVARELEPHYDVLATRLRTDPGQAEQHFYNMRHYAEFQARMMEASVNSPSQPNALMDVMRNADKIGEQTASNGRKYNENWKDEWQQLRQDPTFRPRFEYEPIDPVKSKDATTEQQPTKPVEASFGRPEPLGATFENNGINFAVRSKGATHMELMLFDHVNSKATDILPMNKTGDVWHRFVDGAPEGQLYLYRAFGSYNPAVDGTRFNPRMALIDPYSKALDGVNKMPLGFENGDPSQPRQTDSTDEVKKSVAVRDDTFDWKGDKPPAHDMEDSLIYELNVRGFTGKAEELGKLRGTYRGLVEKIPHLKRLGVTAVELMPIMEYAKSDWHINPVTGEPLENAWGYQTLAFQAPDGKYAADGTRGQQVNEFKYMVQQLHNNGIEVILDIVFNHTGENNEHGPTISFRGLDNNVYYMLAPNAPAEYIDHTGCKNTLNVNEPGVRALILDTLRYWTKEMHVDGFRFDLATVFNYDVDNVDKAKTPVIAEIENDPILSRVKLIAEPWSIDQYKLGHFSETRWAEWNGRFRDVVRQFVKGDEGVMRELLTRIKGSPDMYDPRKGRHSINFVTAHDGFTMNDLVSYAQKHNFLNGEDGADGTNDNHSWNWGVEGPVEKSTLPPEQQQAIDQLREQQIKNMMSILLLSRGTPMILSGDEFRRTADGNNNYWPQDALNMVDWSLAEKHAGVLRFTEMMSALRRRFALGRPQQMDAHGTQPFDQDLGDTNHYLGVQWAADGSNPAQASAKTSLYAGMNSYWNPLEITLPEGRWRRLVDTGLPAGQDIVESDQAQEVGQKYTVQPRTTVIFERIP